MRLALLAVVRRGLCRGCRCAVLVLPVDETVRRRSLHRGGFASLLAHEAVVLLAGLADQGMPQSSSASRLTAGASAFFILSQSGERPER